MGAAAKKNVMAALVLAGLIGCENKSDDRTAAQQTTRDSAAAPAQRNDVNLSNAPLPNKVNVQLSEWAITSSQTEMPKGQVTFAIENKGLLPHAVDVSGPKEHYSSMMMRPGETITMAMDLDTGEYKITCPDSLGAHEKRGMQLTFKVRP